MLLKIVEKIHKRRARARKKERRELMETEGIVDHRGSTGLNQREYKSCFWDERHDAQRNRERVKALDRKFREKYPQIPGDIPAPLCGW